MSTAEVITNSIAGATIIIGILLIPLEWARGRREARLIGEINGMVKRHREWVSLALIKCPGSEGE